MSFPIVERRLDNGLRVCVVEDRQVPSVAVNLWYNVGSRHEAPGKTGFAHLFEHVMFQGSANVANGEHMALMTAVGAVLNATTSFDRTNYFEAVPSGALELALWLEGDRMGGLLAALSQENLDNQRDVVRNERRERYENQPYGTALEQLFAMTFPEGHPYHHMPIGSMEDLAAASLEDVTSFFTTYYTPSNAVLSLVGDVDPDTAFRLADKYFGWITSTSTIPAPADGSIAPRTDVVRRELSEAVPLEAYYAMYRAPSEGSTDCIALDLACAILAGGESSRLTERLVRGEQIAQNVAAGVNPMIGGVSAAVVQSQARTGAPVSDLEAAVVEAIERFIAEGPTDVELEIAKAQREREFLDATGSCARLADEVSRCATLFGDPGHVNEIVDRLNAVTAEQVREVAATWLGTESRAVVTYHLDRPVAAGHPMTNGGAA